MDAVEVVLLVQELKPLHVPGDMAGIRHDFEVFHGGDEPLLLLLEIPRVRERQAFARLLQDLQREFRGRFALGMKMPLQGNRRLRLRLRTRWTVVQDHTSSHRKSCSYRWNRLDELSSGCHRSLQHIWSVNAAVRGLQSLPDAPTGRHEPSSRKGEALSGSVRN